MDCPDFFQHEWRQSNLTIQDNGGKNVLMHLISGTQLPPFANQSLDTLPAQVCTKWNLTEDITSTPFQVTVQNEKGNTLWTFAAPMSLGPSDNPQGMISRAPPTVTDGPDLFQWVGLDSLSHGPVHLSFAVYATTLKPQTKYFVQIIANDKSDKHILDATLELNNDSTLFNCQSGQIETYDGKCCVPTAPMNLECGTNRCGRPIWRNWFQSDCSAPSSCDQTTNMCQPTLTGSCPDMFTNVEKTNVTATFQTTDFMAAVKDSPLNLPPIPRIATNANYELYPLSVCIPFFVTAPVTGGNVDVKVTLKSGKNVVTIWEKSDLPLFAPGRQGLYVKEQGDIANQMHWVGFPEMQFVSNDTPIQPGTHTHLMFAVYNILTNPDDIITIDVQVNGTLTNNQDVVLMDVGVTVDNAQNTCPDNQLMLPAVKGTCCQPPSQWNWDVNKIWECGEDGCGRPVFHNYFESINAPNTCENHQLACQPECEGRQCGDDRCGGSCGTCPHGPCSPYGTCCSPSCDGRKCGPDGCGGVCGTCPSGQTCSSTGFCVPIIPPCVPDCKNKECGADGCGGSCGSCSPGSICTLEGKCCKRDCVGKTCGSDGCGGTCGACASGQVCADGKCCTKTCGPNAQCGSDGCGGICGTCPQQTPVCDENQRCVAPQSCVSDGDCSNHNSCVDGVCVCGTVGNACSGQAVCTPNKKCCVLKYPGDPTKSLRECGIVGPCADECRWGQVCKGDKCILSDGSIVAIVVSSVVFIALILGLALGLKKK